MAGVTERWGAAPTRDEWVAPVVAETVAKTVVTDPSAVTLRQASSGTKACRRMT